MLNPPGSPFEPFGESRFSHSPRKSPHRRRGSDLTLSPQQKAMFDVGVHTMFPSHQEVAERKKALSPAKQDPFNEFTDVSADPFNDPFLDWGETVAVKAQPSSTNPFESPKLKYPMPRDELDMDFEDPLSSAQKNLMFDPFFDNEEAPALEPPAFKSQLSQDSQLEKIFLEEDRTPKKSPLPSKKQKKKKKKIVPVVIPVDKTLAALPNETSAQIVKRTNENNSAQPVAEKVEMSQEMRTLGKEMKEFYQKHHPEKVKNLMTILKKYNDRPALLRSLMGKKYGAAWDPKMGTRLSALEKKKMNTQNEVVLNVDFLKYLKKGSSLLKYGRRGEPHIRMFYLSEDNLRIMWYTKKKAFSSSQICISHISEIRLGQKTSNFARFPSPTLAGKSFSLIYKDGLSTRTLDLIAKDLNEYRMWIKGLTELVKAMKKTSIPKVRQLKFIMGEVVVRAGRRSTVDIKDLNGKTAEDLIEAPVSQSDAHNKSLHAEALRDLRKLRLQVDKMKQNMSKPCHLYHPDFKKLETVLAGIDLSMKRAGNSYRNGHFKAVQEDLWRADFDIEALAQMLQVIKM